MWVYERIIWLAVYVAFSAYAVRLLVQWLRQRKEYDLGWRSILTIVGLCAATVSTILCVFLFVHAQFTGGYSFYHPIELFCIRYGAPTAVMGIAASIAGKGKVRAHLAAVSVINLVLVVYGRSRTMMILRSTCEMERRATWLPACGAETLLNWGAVRRGGRSYKTETTRTFRSLRGIAVWPWPGT
jgi:hypothetical protein